MKWITRSRPKIDRIACPWLIRRFIDPDAIFIYVATEEVLSQAEMLGAIPFDIPDVEFTHYDDQCTFDYFLKKYALNDPALLLLANIVRGADTDHHHLAEQSPGLWAISAGLAHNTPDDNELLDKGMVLYDALYAWAKYLQNEKHTQGQSEQPFLTTLQRYRAVKKTLPRRIPAWVKALQTIIQDQIDTNISLKEISHKLNLNPAYLSREFSKYFENHSFSEYVHKQRIQKAIELLFDPQYSLSDIAHRSGFSDQSHFTRIFKKHMGESPSTYRKKLPKK